MSTAAMDLKTVTTEKRELQLSDIIPNSCSFYDIAVHPTRLLDVAKRLRTAYENALARLRDPMETIERHCRDAIIYYAMDRLTRVENHSVLDIISAIALQDCGSTAECLVRAWERANQHTCARPAVSSRILLDYAIGYHRERLPALGDSAVLMAFCTEISAIHGREVMEDAITLTYRTAHNFICDGGFDAEVILAVHLIEHLGRLGYDEGLVLRAVAVEDVWDLLGARDISAGDAWESARRDTFNEAEERVEKARVGRLNMPMDALNVADATTVRDGDRKPSYAWVGELNGSIKDLKGQAHGLDMTAEETEMHETTMEDLKQKVADLTLVTDDEVMELEQMLATP